MSLVDISLRLFIAALCGGAIGLQVELRERPGGLRTHMLTTVGATAFCLTGISVSPGQTDALRIIQGVASGVGFIGAAAVLREAGHVRGTATAASLWITAAIGCQAALGSVVIAVVLAIFTAGLNAGAVRFERHWLKAEQEAPSDDDEPRAEAPAPS
jgi:putative Mg2+ transporter-C (MgtC) family protein